MTVKYAGECRKCGRAVKQGEQAYYYPAGHNMLCTECGEQGERDFAAAAFDEAVYDGGAI